MDCDSAASAMHSRCSRTDQRRSRGHGRPCTESEEAKHVSRHILAVVDGAGVGASSEQWLRRRQEDGAWSTVTCALTKNGLSSLHRPSRCLHLHLRWATALCRWARDHDCCLQHPRAGSRAMHDGRRSRASCHGHHCLCQHARVCDWSVRSWWRVSRQPRRCTRGVHGSREHARPCTDSDR